MSFLSSVVVPGKAAASSKGGFLASVKPPPADYKAPAPPAPAAESHPVMDFVHSLIDGPVERASAVIESIKQGSLEPLKKSFGQQFSERTPLGTTQEGRPLTVPTVVADLAAGFGPGEAPARALRGDSFLSKVVRPAEENAGQPSVRTIETPSPQPAAAQSAPAGKFQPLKPIESAGPIRQSGLAASVEAQAVEKKLTEGFADLPQYNRVSMADQAQKASKLIEDDPERARRIALGHEAAPADLHPESIFVALEDHALKAGDIETLRDLATRSSLSGEATAMGQRIRTLGERGADSPVAAMQEVKSLREQAFTKRTGKKLSQAAKDTAGEIRQSIEKSAPAKETWDSFITSIECGY